MKTALKLVENGFVPKPLLRSGIRSLLRDRLREQQRIFGADRERALVDWTETMRASPIALVPEKANEQHYEVPPRFFELTLGKRLKYSSGFYPTAESTLDEAEEAMLTLTAQRAQLVDGQDVLELGCGWGSLTLWMGEHFPRSRITAVSNSKPQREHIEREARRRGIANVTVITRDMNTFDAGARFDRIVSVEMFEHMRNWELLLGRVATWLRSDGRLFLHVFAHRSFAYPFDVRDESDWMSRYFFSGGMMPSHDLAVSVTSPFVSEEDWIVPGTHYARTSEDWLRLLEAHRVEVLALFRETYGVDDADIWYQRWRLFYLACAELFAYRDGTEWIVSHRLLRLKTTGSVRP
ncbi:MAG: cyclopropane-fatty-acyl-phospholipid synthase family protein [Planctomycetota bacterium]|nr:cyclopropane-fatty-acyl-phospholipid synthase family protein [Planctomycetota bacterium]